MSDDFRVPSHLQRAWSLTLIIVAVVASATSRSVGIRLGWPRDYWQQGGLVLGAYLLACVLLAILLALLVRAFIAARLMPPVSTLTLLVAVILILRCLPSAQSGVQVLPSLPWNYSGWFSPVIALGAWMFLAFVVCSLLAGDPPQETGIFLGWMLLILTLPLSLCEVPAIQSTPERMRAVEPLGDHHKQIAEWRTKRDEAQRLLDVLQSDREMLAERLRRLGVQSSNDLRDVPEARAIAEELVEVVGQIQGQQKTMRRLPHGAFGCH